MKTRTSFESDKTNKMFFTGIIEKAIVSKEKVLTTTIGFLLLLAFAVNVSAQPEHANPQRGFQSGATYSLSEIETINTTNGNLMLNIPLVRLPAGRGGLSSSISLMYNSKLYDTVVNQVQDLSGAVTDQNMLSASPDGGWKYVTNTYSLRVVSRFANSSPNPCDASGSYHYGKNAYLWRVYIVFPDGSKKEFRPTGYNDNYSDGYYSISPNGYTRYTTWSTVNQGTYVCDQGSTLTTTDPMVYYSTDGSYMKLVVDHTTTDEVGASNPWTLYLPDGGKITGGVGQANRIYDRNGNYIEGFSDIFGRTLTLEHNLSLNEDYVKMRGVNNEELVWTVKWKYINVNKNYTTTGANQQRERGGTSEQTVEMEFRVVDKIILPEELGNLSYEFIYNCESGAPSQGFGEVYKVITPTGASATYEYKWDGTGVPFPPKTDQVLLNYTKKKTLTYDADYDGNSTPVSEITLYTIGATASIITAPDGGITYEYHGDTSREVIDSGLVYKMVNPNGSVVERIWQYNRPYNASTIANINSYVKTEFTSIPDANGNLTLTAIKDFQYDKNGNLTETKEYDFVTYSSVPRDGFGNPTGIPSNPPLKRTTTNTYNNPTPSADQNTNDGDAYYMVSSPNVRNAIATSEIKDENDYVVSRSEMFYDNYSTTANLTMQKVWDSTKGAYTDSSNYISASTTYNSYGMPLTTTDARGTVTQITYGNITGPNGTITDLYPTEVKTAYNTSIQKTAQMEYDFYTGVVTRVKDVGNNVWTTTIYDPFGRPTLVKAAEGTSIETRTVMEYNNELRRVIVKSDLNTTGDGKRVSIQHYDQLGRVRLTRTLEDSTTQSATNENDGIKAQTRYLYNGNFSYVLSSNPYRAATSSSATSEPTMGWSRSKTNNKGQTIEIETFSGASLPAPLGNNSNSTGKVLTDYDANITTVTDQSGKRRKSEINALGQLVKVTEDPSVTGYTGLNYETIYTYDTLSNLTQVNQGIQTRTFAYSSLSRLLTATNPESGTVSYTYDAGGNLLTKQDARNIKTSYSYDQLSRALTRSYQLCPQGQSCQSEGTPTVTYTYDDSNVPFGIGKLTKVSNSVSETSYTSFDALGKLLSSKQRTDGIDYTMSYSYNLSGGLVSQTYPSGRVVTNSFDKIGRPTNVSSKANSNATPRTYANAFTYNASGAVSSIRLGNGRYESTQFNSRLQPTQIALGTSATNTSLLKLEYNYGTNNNNGNVQSQTITVPGMSHPLVQSYTYDALNRLKSATETSDSTQTWKQTFSFDRYGNRMFDTSNNNTTTLPQNFDPDIYNPTLNPANNRMDDEQGYEYDAAGNVTKDATNKRFVYDGENKQTSFGTGGSSTNGGSYFYDGDGKRVKKIVDTETTIFVYNASGQMVAEYTTTAPQNPTISYLTSDTLGSPRINTNASGQVIARHDYMPFGEEIISLGNRTSGNGYQDDDIRQKFTSYERDDESGLDYAKARFFNSASGRFSSPDDFLNDTHASDPQSWNLYVYVRNNPLNLVDPSGQIIKDANGNVVADNRTDIDKHVVRIKDKEYLIYGKAANGQTIVMEAKKITVYADDKTPIKAYKILGELQLATVNSPSVYDKDGNIRNDDATLTDSSTSVALLENMYPDNPKPFSSFTNCHGLTFAEGQVLIDNDQVKALMIGDGYDVDNPSSTPFDGAVGIYSTDGTLDNASHSVRVLDPGSPAIEIENPFPKRGMQPFTLTGGSPAVVASKGGITGYNVTTPDKAFNRPRQILYYGKKAGK